MDKDKQKKPRKRKEKYFICPYCAELKTWTSILADGECGGPGMCDCQYTTLFWSPEFQDLNICTNRSYHEYVKISESWYECLIKYKNHILRRDAFQQIPRLMWEDNRK